MTNTDAIRLRLAQSTGTGPRYREIAQMLAALVDEGALAPGDRLPPERDLAALGGVSRVTIRKAVGALVDQGIVAQRQGSGTFVTRPQRAPAAHAIASLSEELRARGQIGRSAWLTRKIVEASHEDCTALGLAPGSKVLRLTRLRLANERPLALDRSTLPQDVLPDPSVLGQSLYETLQEVGHRPVRVEQRVRAVNLTPKEAEMLDVLTAAAALRVSRVGFDAAGRAVERTETTFRGDAYDVVSYLGGSGQG